MIFLTLFFTFFKIGLFSFGGGYGMLPLMQQEAVSHSWLTDAEFMNFVAISESTPGPVAINMATFIGSSEGGFFGAAVATLGVIAPSVIVILLIVAVFKNFLSYAGVKCVLGGIKPVVAGLILATGVFLGLQNFLPYIEDFSAAGISWQSMGLMAALGAVYVVYKKVTKKTPSAILLILVAAAAGLVIFR